MKRTDVITNELCFFSFCLDPAYTKVIQISGRPLLTCKVMSGNPTDGKISWYLDGQNVITAAEGNYMTSGASLAILHIAAETAGDYTCLLDNGIPGSKCENPYYRGMKKFILMSKIKNSINKFV